MLVGVVSWRQESLDIWRKLAKGAIRAYIEGGKRIVEICFGASGNGILEDTLEKKGQTTPVLATIESRRICASIHISSIVTEVPYQALLALP